MAFPRERSTKLNILDSGYYALGAVSVENGGEVGSVYQLYKDFSDLRPFYGMILRNKTIPVSSEGQRVD